MIEWLFFGTLLLGFLAFFEPCTIATHTLFAVRSHRQPLGTCCQGLALLWLTRSALLAGLFSLVAALTDPLVISPEAAALGLTVLGSLYLISRVIYLPVPHLSLYALIPGGDRWPDGVRLGLTVPACVLPLLVLVGALVRVLDSVPLAALAGLLFATMFQIPILIAASGLDARGRAILDRAARTTPYLTAFLLFGGALILVWPALETEVLGQSLAQADIPALVIAFGAGFLFSFNPLSFAAIPVVLAYVTRAHEKRRAFFLGAAFVAGMVLTHVVLGIGAALGGEWVKGLMGRQWGLVLGPLLILLGLIWPGWVSLRLPWIALRGRMVAGPTGAFLLGIPFTIAICPFCAPALAVALTTSAAIGSVSFGAALLLAFALGRSLPILLGAWTMGWLESLRVLSRYQRGFEILGGLLLISTGLYLLNEYFFFFSD